MTEAILDSKNNQTETSVAVALRRISFGDGVGGMERAAADHINQLVKEGFRVTVFTPTRFLTGPVPSDVQIVDVPWPRWNGGTGVPTFGAAYARWVRQLRIVIETQLVEGSILHLHGAAAGMLRGVFDLQGRNIVCVVNPHGMEEFGRFSLVRAPNRLILRVLVRRSRYANAVIATDKALVPAVRKNLRVPRDRIYCIPNAVDLERLHNLAGHQPQARFTVTSVGRMVHNKGYDILLKALRLEATKASLPADYQWIHFGTGPEEENLVRDAESSPKVPLIVRKGRPDVEVQSVVASSDLFVQPSRYEGSSLTTLEAMAHGVKIVASPVGGIPDKIQDGVTGFLSTEATAAALGQAIARAVEDPTDVGSAARAYVRQEFSLEVCGQRYRELYYYLQNKYRRG